MLGWRSEIHPFTLSGATLAVTEPAQPAGTDPAEAATSPPDQPPDKLPDLGTPAEGIAAAAGKRSRKRNAKGSTSPMMAQYLAIKRAHPGCLLFYRMGDFYEMFFDDAVAAAAALDITLTRRGKHAGEDIPMCGVPVHSHEVYLERLIRKRFKVAICEQVEDPALARKRGARMRSSTSSSTTSRSF